MHRNHEHDAGLAIRLPFALLLCTLHASPAFGEPWQRHTIDNSSRGADGVRLADVNRDGRQDLVTGWEEGGQIRVYLQPQRSNVRRPWPAVTVGKVKSPEDAVFADLDGDGAVDVVSCCEGGNRTVYFHWAPGPAQSADYLEEKAWKTTAVPVTAGKQMWMYALPLELDGKHGVDLVVGSKGKAASVGWLQAPANPHELDQWTFHPLYKAGWIMSLVAHDLDGDGDQDVLISDRKGPNRGVLWLENPGAKANLAHQNWREHRIGLEDKEVMFLDLADLNQDGKQDIVVATRNRHLFLFERLAKSWKPHAVENPHQTPHGKAVRVGDLDGDGRPDIAHSANTGGDRDKPGLVWIGSQAAPLMSSQWTAHDVSGREGVKFDLIELLDLDQDGDLDVLSCEERDNLGVFWYENPLR